MKLKELKHNHSLTDLLKIFIFSLLMLAPILSVATRCLYVVFNKNAYESYYGETINEEVYNPIKNLRTGLDINERYLLTKGNFTTTSETNIGSYSNYISISNPKLISTNFTLNYDFNNLVSFAPYYSASGNNFSISMKFKTGDDTYSNQIIYNNEIIFEFTYVSNALNNDWENVNLINKVTYNKYSYLDNVFEYSVHSLEDNQLFNWTKNTAVYTGVNAMTTNLQIEGSVIPILITYWFLLTIIYVIIDIILKLFTILTHMIGNKTA